jgi:NitT/TauT family transport system permease protein
MKGQTLGYLLSVFALLLLWQLASWIMQLSLPPKMARVLPGPLEALMVFPAHWRDIGNHFLGTGFRLLSALAISFVLAVPLGLVIGHERWARRMLSPLIYTAYPIPKVVFWPILFVLFGLGGFLGEMGKISFVVLVVFFQLLVSARDAAANIPKDYVLSALAAGVSRPKVYWHVVLPGALPAIFTSLRISLGLGIFAVYLAETAFVIGTPKYGGLGYYINNAFEFLHFESVFAGIMAIGILGLGLYLLIEVMERWLCRWKYL